MTDRTPIQFGDDDRQLLRQIAGLVQEIHFSQSALEEKVTGLEARIVGLEAKVDERLYDTRPMWEQLNSRLDKIEARLEKTATREELGDLNRSFIQMFTHFTKMQDRFDERLEKIEKN